MKERDYEEKVWRNSNSNGTVLYSDLGWVFLVVRVTVL